MFSTKVIMVILMMGTSADTGRSVSKVTAINPYPTMAACMAQRNMFRAAMKTGLDSADWLTNGGKVKINHANVVCVDVTKLREKEIPGT